MAMGYLTMAWMFYLIMVTKTTAPKIWDPYSILDISRVGAKYFMLGIWTLISPSRQARHKLRSVTGICRESTTQIKR